MKVWLQSISELADHDAPIDNPQLVKIKLNAKILSSCFKVLFYFLISFVMLMKQHLSVQ